MISSDMTAVMTRQDSVEEMKEDNRGCEYALSLSLFVYLSLFLSLSLCLVKYDTLAWLSTTKTWSHSAIAVNLNPLIFSFLIKQWNEHRRTFK